MGSCGFQCDIPHQWIEQRPVGLVSVYCDGVGCHVLCLRHDIPVRQHIGQIPLLHAGNVANDLRCLKVTLNPNKETNRHIHCL